NRSTSRPSRAWFRPGGKVSWTQPRVWFATSPEGPGSRTHPEVCVFGPVGVSSRARTSRSRRRRMALKLVRIDDRLIHGQIVIVDDKTAKDDFLRDLMILAAPQGVPVEVHGTAEGAQRVAQIAATSENAFVLMKSPVTALALRKAGVPIPVLNVGGMGAGPG